MGEQNQVAYDEEVHIAILIRRTNVGKVLNYTINKVCTGRGCQILGLDNKSQLP